LQVLIDEMLVRPNTIHEWVNFFQRVAALVEKDEALVTTSTEEDY